MPLDDDARSPQHAGPGRPRLFTRHHRTWLRIEASEHADLKRIAADEGKTVTAVIRDAVNEYVGDFREKAVFEQADRRRPPAVVVVPDDAPQAAWA